MNTSPASSLKSLLEAEVHATLSQLSCYLKDEYFHVIFCHVSAVLIWYQRKHTGLEATKPDFCSWFPTKRFWAGSFSEPWFLPGGKG